MAAFWGAPPRHRYDEPMQRRPAAHSRRVQEVVVRRPDPRAWRQALQLTGGDHRRLEVLADGSVTVHNKPLR